MGYSMITIESKGSFVNTDEFLTRMKKNQIFANLEYYGELGVKALREATPVDTGITAESWYWSIEQKGDSYSLVWSNSRDAAGMPIVILLEYGHGTGTGGFVQGRDFINPAIQPIFDQISADVWKAVTS